MDCPGGGQLPDLARFFGQARLLLRCARTQRRWSGVSGVAAVRPTIDPAVCGRRPGGGWGTLLYGICRLPAQGSIGGWVELRDPAGCQSPLTLELHPLIHLPGILSLMEDLLLP
ncbi:hypothetical protein NDU88_005332 [Pleurodeles waltl]|uniref:Uncharacterized protein n=1 Tax=Pleurodeles waltl TaxID=8319 RepID=A0AAV7QFD6_PLEWA|nr:hypothetical protein NDU88_005332 [Pleurodeles waltl]